VSAPAWPQIASSSARQVHGRDSSLHPCWSWAGQDQVTTWLGLASPSGAHAEAGVSDDVGGRSRLEALFLVLKFAITKYGYNWALVHGMIRGPVRRPMWLRRRVSRWRRRCRDDLRATTRSSHGVVRRPESHRVTPCAPHGPGGRACSERQPSAAVTRACIHPDVCVPGYRWGTSEAPVRHQWGTTESA
jgi:hypothetical protein